MRRLFLLLAFVISLPAMAVGVDSQMLADPKAEARARALMQDLRCLVCQNQSISDSDAPLAADLRTLVRERIAAGDSDAEIKAYLVARYGDWVLLDPPFMPATWALWFAPLFVLLLGAWLIWRRTRPLPVPSPPLSASEQRDLEQL